MKSEFKLETVEGDPIPKNGFVPVAIDTEFADTVSYGKLKIHLESSFDPMLHVRVHGRVLSLPNMAKSVLAYQKDEQFPQRRTQVTAAYVRAKLKSYIDVTPVIEKAVTRSYFPTAYVKKGQPLPREVNIKVGDTVYFHYLIVHEENYLGRNEEGEHVYKVPYDQIFCKLKGKKPIALNNYVLVEKVHDESGFKEVMIEGRKRMVKIKLVKMDDGTLKEMVVGVDPHRIANQGIIASISPPVGHRGRTEVKDEDYVAYKEQSEYENKIKGNMLYVMRQHDILGKRVRGKWHAVGDMVLIKPLALVKKGNIILNSGQHPNNNRGTIVSIGKKVTNFSVGNRVLFNLAKRVIINDELIALAESQVPMEI